MKPSSLLLLIASCAVATAGAAQNESAQSDRAAERTALRVVTATDLDRQVTVSDLLGKDVVDQNQERLGRLHDIDLSGVFQSDGTAGGSIALLVSSDADESEDLVSIEAERVRFDSAQGAVTVAMPAAGENVASADRSTPAATSEDDALAPADVAALDPANTIEPVAVAAVPGSDIEVATTGTEVLQIEQALAQNDQTREVADQISVMSSTDAILLTGEIENDEQRQAVLKVAREASHREVRDLLNVAAE